MTYQLSDQFSDSEGRFNAISPWDGTEHSEGAKSFLTTQSHVDIRDFRVYAALVPVPQFPDLDTVAQSVLDAETQADMEEKHAAPSLTENWILSGTGVNALTVGALSAYGGWSGLQVTTTGIAIDATLTSSVPGQLADISDMDFVSLILPDFNTLDANTTITFTSSTDGTFGDGHDSAAIQLGSSLDPMPEWRFATSDLTLSGFEPAAITGVKIDLKMATAPTAGHVITIMAIRGTAAAWEESALDFDTRIGALCVPVTLNGAQYSGNVAVDFEFVRGDGTKLDPIPADGAYYLYFYPGGSTSPNDATGTDHNVLAVILREQKDTTGGTGQHIEARLKWNDAETIFESAFISSTGGSPGTVVESAKHAITVGGTLDSNTFYVFQVQIKGTQILAAIYETDINLVVGNLVWQNTLTISDSAYTYKNGRVGFIANLLSRDSYLTAFDVAPTGYCEFITRAYPSRTPVDGLQLTAIYSPDMNLFNSIDGPDIFVDQTKTLSGRGSYRSARSMTTNTFIIDDWTQTYLNLAIWVPTGVTLLNQPIIFINTASGQENITLPALQAAQWNNLYFDLGLFRNLVSAASYSLTISASPTPDKPLGFFWVDDIFVGRRRVQWSTRATPNGLWRDFQSLVNDPTGGVHFTPEERGTSLQLKAVALTEDAWVSSCKIFPRYAQLGLPVYDQAFET